MPLPPPVTASAAGWSSRRPLLFRLCVAWAKWSPRGKGAVPRKLGRRFGRNMKVTIPTNAGAQLAVDPDNLDVYTTILLEAGAWDAHIYRACADILRHGGVFYDIGANGGSVGVDVAKMTHGKAAVIAFEPQPSLAHTTAVSAAVNRFPSFTTYQIMVGEADGEGTLFIPSHSIHASAVSREEGAAKITCPVRTIDSLVASGMPPPNVMKVDVEGGEMAVFKGARDTITRYKPYLLFESDINMSRFGYGRRELLGLLLSMTDYTFHEVHAHGLRKIDPDETPAHSEGDILAVPPGGRTPGISM